MPFCAIRAVKYVRGWAQDGFLSLEELKTFMWTRLQTEKTRHDELSRQYSSR